ncbi:MAG: flagellar hook-basal body complex protein FliE [Desulfobacterales bacterium]|nr:flagellar hook-basal body complex protein FliE [Desulfobacterales bacterium]
MKDITLVSYLKALPLAGPGVPAGPVAEGFSRTLRSAVAQVNRNQMTADHAVENFQIGESRNLHEVMIAVEKADISLRMMVQVRNKVIEAYQEIMRMQV